MNMLCCYCCDMEGLIMSCFKCGLFSWVPPNSCCTSNDSVTKVYFDRGVFDRQFLFYQSVCGNDPLFTGAPEAYYGPCKYQSQWVHFVSSDCRFFCYSEVRLLLC